MNRAALYDWEVAQVAQRNDQDAAFYVELVTGPVLELACGTGRLTQHLARAATRVNARVVGVDLDAEMLAAAKRKTHQGADLLQADMSCLHFAGRPFALVAIPYNSLQLLTTVDAQVACLAGACAALRPGGRLALEVSTFGAGGPVDEQLLAAAGGIKLWGSLEVDGPFVRYRKRFTGAVTHHDETVLRDYAAGEFEEVLAAGGFAVEAARPFRQGRLVVAAPAG